MTAPPLVGCVVWSPNIYIIMCIQSVIKVQKFTVPLLVAHKLFGYNVKCIFLHTNDFTVLNMMHVLLTTTMHDIYVI